MSGSLFSRVQEITSIFWDIFMICLNNYDSGDQICRCVPCPRLPSLRTMVMETLTIDPFFDPRYYRTCCNDPTVCCSMTLQDRTAGSVFVRASDEEDVTNAEEKIRFKMMQRCVGRFPHLI